MPEIRIYLELATSNNTYKIVWQSGSSPQHLSDGPLENYLRIASLAGSLGLILMETMQC